MDTDEFDIVALPNNQVAVMYDQPSNDAFVIGDNEKDEPVVRILTISEEGQSISHGQTTINVAGQSQKNNEPAIATLDDGGFMIFYDNDRGAGEIRGQRYDESGDRVGDDFVVFEGVASNLSATTSEDGRVAVTFIAGAGNDVIDGGNSDDTIRGGEGNDTLHGGSGKDKIVGGAGHDMMTGGNGKDVFVFSEQNFIGIIEDFKPGSDRIDLSDVAEIEHFKDLTDNHLEDKVITVLIDDGAGTLVSLLGVDVDDLSARDFIF
ncbi:hypothetical protein AB1M95_17890 [Sulfitobacter sp. LCG007]